MIRGHLKLFCQEPLEANNKVFKRFREHFARKTSREANLYDVFSRTSVCSDPLILKHVFQIKRNVRKYAPFPQDIVDFFKPISQYGLK